MHRYRFWLLPVGALALAVLSYGFAGVATAPNAAPSAEPETAITQPALPADGAPLALSGTTDTDQRIRFWQDRISANPTSDVQYQYLGELFAQKGRETGDVAQYELAAEAFQKAVELYPGNASARSGLAVNLVTLHRWADAIDEAKVILQADRRAYGAVAVIGDASLEIGDLETAASAFETLRQVADSPSVDSRFARLAFLSGDTDQAIEILEDAAKRAADLNRPAEEQAFYRYSAGEYRFSQGDVDGAAQAYDAALALLPKYYLAVAGGGRVAFARGDLEGAIAAYETAVAIIPKPEFLAYLGDLYTLSGDMAASEKQYETVDFIAKLGDLRAELSNRTIALFQASHRRDTAHAVQLATIELTERTDVYGYDAVAWSLFNDGQASDALAPARKALALGTRDASLLYHVGMIELALGLEGDGREHVQAALDLNPAFDPLGAATARDVLGD